MLSENYPHVDMIYLKTQEPLGQDSSPPFCQ